MFQVSWNLLISRDKASSTMMESSGMSTKPWCTPNFTSNLSLRPLHTQSQLLHSCTFLQVSQSIPQHQALSLPIRSLPNNDPGRTPSLGPREPYQSVAYRDKLLLQLADGKDCICCASAWEEPNLLFVTSHHLSNEAVGHSLNDFHSLLRQFLSSIVASVQSISPFPL